MDGVLTDGHFGGIWYNWGFLDSTSACLCYEVKIHLSVSKAAAIEGNRFATWRWLFYSVVKQLYYDINLVLPTASQLDLVAFTLWDQP
jgi:hypothetical protein